MTKHFDVVVIGTGSAASTVASRSQSAGRTVAVIDSRPFGGTCALRGCDPKKVLVGAAEALHWSRRLEGKGIHAPGTRIDWPELMRFKRSFTEDVASRTEEKFEKNGFAAFHGRARFDGPGRLRVGDDELTAGNFVIAAGSRPGDLGIPGASHVITSTDFLELDQLPPRVLFIGGGYISFEFAHIVARVGSRVIILHRGEHPLGHFDPDLVKRSVEGSRNIGIDVQLETEVKGIDKTAGGFLIHATSNGADRTFETDLVVHGAGRVPEIDDMNLSSAGVDWDPKRGVTVNEFLQSTSNPAVYAAGDAAASAGPKLTPVAGYEAQIVADNMLNGNQRTPNYDGTPSIVFTVPALSSVGLQEAAAKKNGMQFQVNQAETQGWYSSRRIGESLSGFKVLVEEETGRILGAHLLGPGVEETINLFGLAIKKGLTASDLKEVLYGYPTLTSDVKYML